MTNQDNEMNAKSRLQAQEAKLRESGVIDVKFFFNRSMKPLTGVVSEVVEVFDAVLQKRYEVAQKLGDSVNS